MVVVTNMEMDIVPVVSDGEKANPKVQTNWATNIIYSTNVIHEVKSIEEIRALMQSQDLEKVTVFGTGHTFNFLADNLQNRLSLRHLHGVLELDPSARTVEVDAGIRYDQLCPYLESKGFAIHNLPSLTEICIAGGISTAAHGSGTQNRNLATAVCALEMVTSNGDIVKLSRQSDSDSFSGAVVGLGALGVITRLTLDIEPTFTMRQYVYENLPIAQVQDHFEAIMGSGYTVSLFTDWQDARFHQMWIKVKHLDGNNVDADEENSHNGGHAFPKASPPPQELFGAKLQTEDLHLYRGEPPNHSTEQMGVTRPWYQILPHFRVGNLLAVGTELQSEYFVPRHHAVAAILAVESLRDHITPLLLVSEVRTIARDDLWMSMAYGRDSMALHFSWTQDWKAVERVLPMIESALAPFDPRPHWGKLFCMSAAIVQSKYERLDDFIALAAKLDPRGKFRNEFLNTNVFTR